MLICACSLATPGCTETCPKGRLIEPDRASNVPWIRYYTMDHVMALQDKVRRETINPPREG